MMNHLIGRTPLYQPSAGDICKGMIAGAIGGLIASWAMNQAHGIAGTIAKLVPENRGGRSRSGASSESEGAPEAESSSGTNQQAPATVVAAQSVTRRVAGTELSERQQQAAGPLVHYGYGTAMGALYGGLCEAVPQCSVGAGVSYGAVLWLVGDEIAVPLLGLSAPPTEIPPSSHTDALAAHAVYGLTTDCVRRLVRDGL